MKPTSLSFLALLAWAITVSAQTTAHPFIVAEYGNTENRFLEYNAQGKVIWEHRPPSIAVIFEILPNGNLLYAYGGKPTGAREVTRSGVEVWNYVSKSAQVLGCTRLPNGNTLLGEQGPCQAVEVNPKGEIVHTTPLRTSHEDHHQQVRHLYQLANGNILAAHEGEGAVREVDQTGKVVWEFTGVAGCGNALRLPSGNTLIACGGQQRIIEVTPDKTVAWEFTAADAPELNIGSPFSLQILKSGNIVVGNFIRGKEGEGAHAFEVTRDKKIVWGFEDHKTVKSITSLRVIEE